eukprot:jgi/Undpi1/13549/HiC_scaffold_8.g03208.m1
MRQLRQQAKSKTGAKRGGPVDCTVRTGCKPMIKAGVVEPYGQVSQKETRKSGREKQDLLAAKPERGSVSLDRRGSGAEKKKDHLRPVLLEVFRRHRDMDELSPDEVSVYVDTVLAIIFYRVSRCGVVLPSDLRCSGFIKEFDAVGRMEKSLEDSEYFSISLHEHIRLEYFRLCGRGWSVGEKALRFYRHGDGSAVGAVRAERVINAGLRPFPRHQHTGSSAIKNMPGMPGGYGQPLDYEAWVCFFLCEEAVRGARKWSERDVSYCFDLVDQTGGGRIGMADFTQHFQDVFWDSINFGESHDNDWPTIQEVVSHHLDAMGIDKGRSDVTLKELVKPGNVVRAGRFFTELFTGTAPRERGYHSDNDNSNDGDDSDDPADSTEEEAGEEDCEGTDGGDEDESSGGTTGEEGQQHTPPPAAAAAAVAEPCLIPVSPVQQQQQQQHEQHHQPQGSVVYLENHHGTYYPVPALPLQQQQVNQCWVGGGENAGGYPIQPQYDFPQATLAHNENVPPTWPMAVPPFQQQQHQQLQHQQTAAPCLVNVDGTCFPVSLPPPPPPTPPPPPLQQQQQEAFSYEQNAAETWFSCPMPQQHMHPWAVGHGEEGVESVRHTSSPNLPPPQPPACGDSTAGMCPPQVLPMQQYPPSSPPMEYGRHMHPIEMPQGPSFSIAWGGNPEGGMYPPGGPQWRQPFFTCSEGHLSGAVYGQAPTAHEGGCHFGGTVYSQAPVACAGGCW